MRIISGKYKGRRITPPANITARPTTDFAKESLFNWLGNKIDFEDISVLDLFAGTGSISLEFISRGAKSVIAVDMANTQLDFMRRTAVQMDIKNWAITRADVMQYIKRCTLSFDVIFADPPYQMPELPELPQLIMERQLLKPDGLLIVEHPKQYDFTQHPNFHEHRNYGNVNFSLFV
jgi:16S rRNA (guanine(966)-N(2))-methyltransferase RsmD